MENKKCNFMAMDDNLDEFTNEQLKAMEDFLESIQDQLYDLGESGDIEFDLENKTIIAKSDTGEVKVFKYEDYDKLIKNQMN